MNDDDIKVISGLKENKCDTYYAFPNTTGKELQGQLRRAQGPTLERKEKPTPDS